MQAISIHHTSANYSVQTVAEATRNTHDFMFTHGLPHRIRTPEHPAMRSSFTEWLKGHGIKHQMNQPTSTTSQHAVGHAKSLLENMSKPSVEQLRETSFALNNIIQKDYESANSLFFKRGPRSTLPNSIKREIVHRDIIQRRNENQDKLAKVKGRSKNDIFKENDEVILQDPRTSKWSQQGVVKSKCASDESDVYMVELAESGMLTIRDKKFIKHMMQRPQRIVKFDTKADTIPDIHGDRVHIEDPASQPQESNPTGAIFERNADNRKIRHTHSPNTQRQSISDSVIDRN